MQIHEILHHKGSHVSSVRTTETVATAVTKLHAERIGALVVFDRWGKLAGMFSERDVIRSLAEYGAETMQYEVHELMTPDVTTCAPTDRVSEVMGVMTAHRVRHLPVMDDGKLVGLVSIGDLVKTRLDMKETEANVLRDITRARV
jgi:CBS domain-containing protein